MQCLGERGKKREATLQDLIDPQEQQVPDNISLFNSKTKLSGLHKTDI